MLIFLVVLLIIFFMAITQSLANKYRPDTFDNVVEQSHIVSILKSQAQQWSDHSNYLFFWPRGTGKTTSARLLAKALNCLNLNNGNPCNKCNNCLLINSQKTLDFVEIDAASHTGVDNIREEILWQVDYPPTTLKKKVYIIDEVHMLSKGAFNALLKIMEEPPVYICFILATTEIPKVPETIVSRCQVFHFKKLHVKEITTRLELICQQEKLSYEIEALELISKLAEWWLRDAIKYVDQVSVLGDISLNNVTDFLWVASQMEIDQFLSTMKTWSFESIVQFLNTLTEQGRDLAHFSKQVMSYCDQHFMQDPQFYTLLTKQFASIHQQIKFFPYPLMAYKIWLYEMMQGKSEPSHISQQVSQQNKSDSFSTFVQSSPVVSPSTPSQTSSDQVDHSSSSTHKFVQQHTVSQPVWWHGDWSSMNLATVWNNILNNLKPSLKMILQPHASLRAHGSDFQLIIINQMAYQKVNQPEHSQAIQQLRSEIGPAGLLHIVYQSKEDFLSL